MARGTVASPQASARGPPALLRWCRAQGPPASPAVPECHWPPPQPRLSLGGGRSGASQTTPGHRGSAGGRTGTCPRPSPSPRLRWDQWDLPWPLLALGSHRGRHHPALGPVRVALSPGTGPPALALSLLPRTVPHAPPLAPLPCYCPFCPRKQGPRGYIPPSQPHPNPIPTPPKGPARPRSTRCHPAAFSQGSGGSGPPAGVAHGLVQAPWCEPPHPHPSPRLATDSILRGKGEGG